MTMADRIAVMNGGHVEQLARPSELYDAPATGFVARFIGDISELDGTLAGDEAVIDDGTRVPIGRRLAEIANGSRVSVGVRPEGATVTRADDRGAATVVTSMVLGDRLQFVVRVGQSELLVRQARTADDAELAGLEPGTPVDVAFAPRSGLLLGEVPGTPTVVAEVAAP